MLTEFCENKRHASHLDKQNGGVHGAHALCMCVNTHVCYRELSDKGICSLVFTSTP